MNLFFKRRYRWRKRKAGETLSAIYTMFSVMVQSGPGWCNVWLATGLFAFWIGRECPEAPEPRMGVELWLLPRINRKDGEYLYLIRCSILIPSEGAVSL